MNFNPSKYYKYDELVEQMNQWHKDYPELTKLYSIGQSYEGRDMWLIELTNKETGKSEDKPGYYIDGNFHAGEVTGCATAMYTVNHLLENYGKDEEVTFILDKFVVYVVPRVSVDGAEMYLTTAMTLRSSTRPYPFTEKQPGLHIKDMNDDGYITQMRVKDPNGKWKVSDKDERLMVSRQPDDFIGEFYNLYDEGEIIDFDGVEVKIAPRLYGLDVNRNSPVNWKPEHEQKGAGPYPFSEPEPRNVADFILSHKNIAGLMSYHTTSGVHLRPSAQKPDSEMNKTDVKMFKEIGERGKEYTKYPHVNTFEGFVSSPQTGIFMDWAYENEGILSWSTELWDLLQRAGIEIENFKDRYKKKTFKTEEEDGLKVLKWNDEELDGNAFIPWTKFDHPQLGEVEIGGYKMKFFRQNPPEKLLEQECKKNMQFTLVHMKALPKLDISEIEVEDVSENVKKITGVVSNIGYQPTSGTEVAQKLKKYSTVKVEMKVKNGEVISQEKEIDLGHLEGWSKKKVQWVVKIGKDSELEINATSDRAGKCIKKVEI
ncbi:MAG: M14 family metallopeptidase [Clostridia bacterium]